MPKETGGVSMEINDMQLEAGVNITDLIELHSEGKLTKQMVEKYLSLFTNEDERAYETTQLETGLSTEISELPDEIEKDNHPKD
ncbi:MAG: hypothetical protein WCX97_02780 [Candidatus Magasanikbacteria bacterium]